MAKKAKSINTILAAAKGGDANAQYDLATRYREANGVPEDLAESLHWYRKAAEAKHVPAMNDFGTMLRNGIGCKRNDAEAFKWYKKAAEAGQVVACCNLAMCYVHGYGVKVNNEEAFYWFCEAAKRGYTDAILELGTMYRYGEATERNLVAAADFHLIAAKKGDTAAIGYISEYLSELTEIALAGDPIASRCLTDIYNLGLGAEKSKPLTWAWAKWAKEDCPPSDDADEFKEIESAYVRYKRRLSAKDRKEGERLLGSLTAARGIADAPRESPSKSKDTTWKLDFHPIGRYVPDPDNEIDGVDGGLYDNDCGFDEAPIRAGSEEELEMFEIELEMGRKPEEILGESKAYKKRYAKFLKAKGIDAANLVRK